MINRDSANVLHKFIQEEIKNKDVLIVEGARQVGKTSVVLSVLEKIKNDQDKQLIGDQSRNGSVSRPIITLNLEKDKILTNEFESAKSFSDIEASLKKRGFDKNKSSIVFIDEAQESENFGNYVRFLKEDFERQTFILSGSSMSRLFINSRYPVGRAKTLRITPFSFREYLRAYNKEHLQPTFAEIQSGISDILHFELLNIYDQYLTEGGMPSVVVDCNTKQEKDDQRMVIYISQQEDFYRKLPRFRKDYFDKALTSVSSLLGFPFSFSKISDNHRIAKDLIAELNAWHLVSVVDQTNPNATSNFHPKLYLYDVGLARQLKFGQVTDKIGIVTTTIPQLRTAIGGLIENSIYLEMQAGFGYLQKVTGWKRNNSTDKEVDFIINIYGETGGIPIEIKASLNFQNKYLRGLIEYLNIYNLNLGILVSGDKYKEITIEGKKIVNLPVYGSMYFREVL